MEKIPCTVGILTYNSHSTLRRALESVKDFHVVVADGGSTDDTLATAQEFGAKIITQSQLGKPITDFALERNRILDASATDWFMYIDSDEVMSKELAELIRTIASEENPKTLVYQVRYMLTSPDIKVRYQSFVPYYQPRLFHKASGARFTRPVHERVVWDKEKFPPGHLEAPWLVPLDVQLDFRVYKQKVNHRLTLMFSQWHSKNPFILLKKGIIEPLIAFMKQIVRMVYTRMRYPRNELVPLRYDIYRLYSPIFIVYAIWRQYFINVRKL